MAHLLWFQRVRYRTYITSVAGSGQNGLRTVLKVVIRMEETLSLANIVVIR